MKAMLSPGAIICPECQYDMATDTTSYAMLSAGYIVVWCVTHDCKNRRKKMRAYLPTIELTEEPE